MQNYHRVSFEIFKKKKKRFVRFCTEVGRQLKVRTRHKRWARGVGASLTVTAASGEINSGGGGGSERNRKELLLFTALPNET